MSRKLFKDPASALALGCAACLAALTLQAQPMYDRIHVNLPYTVTMQNKTLQPGDYTIQQLPSTGDSRVLLFYTKDGMKFETSAMTIPTLDQKTPSDTKVILGHVGDDYYISKIWVQGKDYGYELPVPDNIKSRQNERMTESTVTATNQPSSNTDMTTATTSTTTAQTTQPAQPAENANRPVETAPAQPATQPEPQPAPQPEPQATTPPPAANNSADRAMPDQTPAATPSATQSTTPDNGTANRKNMPATSAGWLTMLLSGGALSGAGLMLRRKR